MFWHCELNWCTCTSSMRLLKLCLLVNRAVNGLSTLTLTQRIKAARPMWALLLCISLIQAANAQLLSTPMGALMSSGGGTNRQPTCRMSEGAAHEYCGLPYELSNFQGHFKCEKEVLVGRPTNYQELARLVQGYEHVKAVGVGHSWWKEQFCAGKDSNSINIVTTELQEVHSGGAIKVDEGRLTATAPAGVTQRTLLEFLDAYRTDAAPDGYTLPAYSWFLDQTMGGAVATATHGSSLVYGSLSSQLRGLKIMVANGTVLDLTPGSSPHLWRAAAASVGRLGITLEVTMSIVKNSPIRRDKQDVRVPDFVSDINDLSRRFSAAVANNSQLSLAVWEAVKPWDETSWFWFIPNEMLWRATFQHQKPLSPEDVQQVLAADGPSGSSLPPGAFQQQAVKAVGTGPNIDTNARFWSNMYRSFLAQHVTPGVLPARQAFLSVTETESRLGGSWNSYDQYEAAIPLSKAGACVQALSDELYGIGARWNGFRTPALVRLIRAENAYLSPAHGEPVLYINMEDHVSYAAKKPNEDFQAIMQILRSPVCGPARLHWGKAGWPQWASCFDGAKEYPKWCDFGCAVRELDPYGKFAGTSDVWQWAAVDRASGQSVEFGSCCGPSGFDSARCSCASRSSCQ